jgi:hypothetical protein
MSYVQDLPKVAEEHETVDQEFCAFFESIKGVIKASSRPLPTQTGDGTYIQPPISTGLLLDLSTTDAKDVETVLGVLKAKVTGAPTNDRTYLMERTINARRLLPSCRIHSTDLRPPACFPTPANFDEWESFDPRLSQYSLE